MLLVRRPFGSFEEAPKRLAGPSDSLHVGAPVLNAYVECGAAGL